MGSRPDRVAECAIGHRFKNPRGLAGEEGVAGAVGDVRQGSDALLRIDDRAVVVTALRWKRRDTPMASGWWPS